jgi:polyhydroxyalkanoate synthesis repressor PhaR
MARQNSKSDSDKPVVIKKYANRRLYNTATSSYVTLDHLCQMVKDDVDFAVYDAKTGEDITRSVLTQIIVEEEAKGTNLLPITFLRQLIGFYGHSMQGMVPRYLEHMMAAFAQNQDRLRQQMQETMSGMFPFGTSFEEMSRQNAALMESAMKMFTPFSGPRDAQARGGGDTTGQGGTTAPSPANVAPTEDAPEALARLQQQVNQLQRQINALGHTAEAPKATSGDAVPGDGPDGAAQNGEADPSAETPTDSLPETPKKSASNS